MSCCQKNRIFDGLNPLPKPEVEKALSRKLEHAFDLTSLPEFIAHTWYQQLQSVKDKPKTHMLTQDKETMEDMRPHDVSDDLSDEASGKYEHYTNDKHVRTEYRHGGKKFNIDYFEDGEHVRTEYKEGSDHYGSTRFFLDNQHVMTLEKNGDVNYILVKK
tara:strand:- start:833 stop:1312 length:480 start_codon:yes stop_codon:yes gene_type:complete